MFHSTKALQQKNWNSKKLWNKKSQDIKFNRWLVAPPQKLTCCFCCYAVTNIHRFWAITNIHRLWIVMKKVVSKPTQPEQCFGGKQTTAQCFLCVEQNQTAKIKLWVNQSPRMDRKYFEMKNLSDKLQHITRKVPPKCRSTHKICRQEQTHALFRFAKSLCR